MEKNQIRNRKAMKTTLEKASFTFSQDGNCVDGQECETLVIRCESSLGIDRDESAFYVLETERWSIDSINDLKELFNRVNKSLNIEKL